MRLAAKAALFAGVLAMVPLAAAAQTCRDVGRLSDRIYRDAARFSELVAQDEESHAPGEACRLFLRIRRDLDTVLAVINEHPRQCGVRPDDIDTLTHNQAGFATITRCDRR